MKTGADGIALHCDKGTLFYTALSSRLLWAIPTEILKNNEAINSTNAPIIGYKGSASDGLMFTEKGNLYMTDIENNAILKDIYTENDLSNFDFREFTKYGGDNIQMWPDTLGFNNQDREILYVSNQLNLFVQNKIDFDNPLNGNYNYRIYKIKIDDRSYLYDCKFRFTTSNILLIVTTCVLAIIAIAFIIFCVFRNYQKRKLSKEENKENLINN